MTPLAKPPTEIVACGKDFHREILASMTTPELFERACLLRKRVPETIAWRSVTACFLRSATTMSGPEIAWVTGSTGHSTVFTQLRLAKPVAEWGAMALLLYERWRNACDVRVWGGAPTYDEAWVWAWEGMKK